MSSQYLDPNPQALKKIRHIVVLMMENRSFDNLLGWLYDEEKPPRGQHYEGLNDSLWNPFSNVDSDGNAFIERVGIRRNGEEYRLGRKKMPGKEDFTLPSPDPGEGYKDTNYQLFQTYNIDDVYPPEPLAQGFVDNYEAAMKYGTYSFQDAPTDPREIMTCYTPKQTPVISTLAREFAVCDQYFCSVPSQTLPNRDFIHAATSAGFVNNKPDDQVDSPTIYNQIQDAIDGGRCDLSWRIYSGTEKDKDSGVWIPFSLTRIMLPQIQDAKFNANFRMMKDFYADAKAGNLPSYSFLEPQFSGPLQNDQHPPMDIRPGEKLMADVYNAVRDSPCWEETLLVITYDEHGGCYDHHPPTATAKTPDERSAPGQFGFRFNRFGVRVPAVVISPLIRQGTIARPSGWTPFDHTSVIRTVQNCFGLHGTLTERDAAAPDLSCILSSDDPRTDKPEVTPLAYEADVVDGNHVNDLHRQLATTLSRLTGQEHPSEEQVHQFIHDAYAELFADN